MSSHGLIQESLAVSDLGADVKVRGCGCCLPIPLAMVVGSCAGVAALVTRCKWMVAFFSDRLGCIGSIVVSVILTVILLLILNAIYLI